MRIPSLILFSVFLAAEMKRRKHFVQLNFFLLKYGIKESVDVRCTNELPHGKFFFFQYAYFLKYIYIYIWNIKCYYV
jgi:hypothetical protein